MCPVPDGSFTASEERRKAAKHEKPPDGASAKAAKPVPALASGFESVAQGAKAKEESDVPVVPNEPAAVMA